MKKGPLERVAEGKARSFAPETSSQTRLELEKVKKELERVKEARDSTMARELRTARGHPFAPETSSRTRLELERVKKELDRVKESKATGKNSRLAYLEGRHANAVKSRLQEVKKLITDGQTTDLAFLFDTTSSMQPHIDLIKHKVMSIAEGIGAEYPECKLRVAFAQYRDYDDTEDCASCDFTRSFQGSGSTFVTALSRVRAIGGGDIPEDVFTGLERLASLSWEASNRVVIHIADAPCHGTQFHDLNLADDKYPFGDKLHRDIKTLLQNLREGRQISTYSFHHVHPSITKKMWKEFKRAAGPEAADWIQEEQFDISSTPSKVVTVCTKTISKTLSTVAIGRASTMNPEIIDRHLEIGVPEWRKIAPEECKQFKYKWYDNLNELLGKLRSGRTLELEVMGCVYLRIAHHPFSKDGATRWPYHAQLMPPKDGYEKSSLQMVLKRFKLHVGEDSRKAHEKQRYLDQMEVQSVSAQLAQEFNKRTCMLGTAKQVTFTLVSMVAQGNEPNCKFYNMEKVLHGKWIKYSSNAGYVNTEDYAATLQVFSHWTHERCNGQLMVTDLQGVQIAGNEFWLCDPAIHCTDMLRFTRTNLGEEGFKLFYKSHLCNDVCRKLNLVPGKNGSTTKGTILK